MGSRPDGARAGGPHAAVARAGERRRRVVRGGVSETMKRAAMRREEKRVTFKEALATQRWDDHRFYHHNRINQSLHLVSALSFLCAYVMLAVEPAIAVLIAWLFAMPTRQAGHFFFEPHTYDAPNQVTHEYKEDVKVGYNLRRKVWLMSIWILSPLLLLIDPSCLGLLTPATP